MLTTKMPIGEIVSFLYNNDKFNYLDNIVKDIRNLIDLIIIRVNENDIFDTLVSFEADLFKLRIEIINKPEVFKDIIKNLDTSIKERIKYQFNHATKYKQLELAFVNSISIYGDISEHIINNFVKQTTVWSASSFQFPNLSYSEYISLLYNLPGKESKIIISFLKSSITLDFALIVSELIFDKKLVLKASKMKSLISMLKNSIEDFAVYSNQLGLWSPSYEDERQWIRNIKIRISLLNSEFISKTIKLDDINQIVTI